LQQHRRDQKSLGSRIDVVAYRQAIDEAEPLDRQVSASDPALAERPQPRPRRLKAQQVAEQGNHLDIGWILIDAGDGIVLKRNADEAGSAGRAELASARLCDGPDELSRRHNDSGGAWAAKAM
jgi:hypothetical protein